MHKSARLSDDGKYRYVLIRREKDQDCDLVNFVLLNPSVADETIDDPTIKALTQITKNLEFQGFCVTNLFAYRATKPADLKKEVSPVGEENDKHLIEQAQRAKLVILAWGNHGEFLKRDKEVLLKLSKIKPLYCLKLTKKGNPWHPLYLKRDVKYFKYL